MAVTITRTQVRQEMLKRAPVLGRALTADSLAKAGTTLTDVSEYERQRAGLTSYEGQYINRYLQADPDNWRLITTVDTTNGIISVDGPAWANNTDLAYERLTVFPDDLNFAIAEGQRRQRIRTNIALVAPAIDLDMESAGVLFWGTSGGSTATNVTPTKSTTQVFSGTQSLVFTGTGASPTLRSALMRVTPLRQMYAACIVWPFTGPISFNLYDANNLVTFGATVTMQPYGDWTLMFIQAQIPANCELVQLQFSSTNAAAVFYIDTCFGPYLAGQTEYPIQSGMDEAYKLRFVRPATFVSAQQTAGCADANSLSYMGDLTRPEDWDLEVFRRDVNANRLRFQANSYNNSNVGWTWRRGMGGNYPGGSVFMQNGMRPIWLAMEAQASAFEPLLTETSTTSQPLDECACYSLRYVAETMTQRDPTNSVWQNMLAEYKMWSVIEDMARPPQAMQTPQRYHAVRA